MTLTDIPNYKQRIIAKWLFYECSSDNIVYEIFKEYNPEYPNKIKVFIKL
jgi:hypothetical protein